MTDDEGPREGPPGDPAEPGPPQLGSVWWAIGKALLIIGLALCIWYGLGLAFLAFVSAGGMRLVGYNK